MKTTFLTILFTLSVCAINAHTDDGNLFSLFPPIISHKVPLKKDGAVVLYDKSFTSTLVGAIDTVWQHVEPHPGKQDVISNPLFAASDGSFYLASTRNGGFLTKISNNGTIEWTINRNFSGDTTIKYFTQFMDISELSNGDIIACGSEGICPPAFPQLMANVPNRFIISQDGIVKEERTTRSFFSTLLYPRPIYSIFPATKIFIENKPDSIVLFSMDTSLTTINNTITFGDEYKSNNHTFIGIKPYDSSSFIFAYQGIRPKPDSLFSMILLRFSRTFELLNRSIIYTKAVGDVDVYHDGSFLIVTRGAKYRVHLTKLDRNANVLWDREPAMLKDIPLSNFKVTKSPKGGFIITGEIFPQNNDGSINGISEERKGFIGKLNDEGECLWYYTTGRQLFRNTIQNFAEADNGDIITVCNSVNTGSTFDAETYMQITRLRPKATSVNEQPAASDGIELYPNPTSTSFTLSGVEGVASVRLVILKRNYFAILSLKLHNFVL
jgi:hypothetical protein